MSSLIIQSGTLDDIADAIRAKDGDSSIMTPVEMATRIANIPSGGGGTRHYIVQDGQVVNGHTLSCMSTTTLTTETSEGVTYLKALTDNNNYGAVWTENYDFSAYDYMVVEFLKVDNSYGKIWGGGGYSGWCVGLGSASIDANLTAGASEQLTPNGATGQVFRGKFIATIPASIGSTGHYVKLQTTANGTGSNAGWLNILNLYAVAE